MKVNKYFIILNLIVLLGYLIYSVVNKEEILKNGKLVLLELAPVDPRSLMQGDFMNLNYSISNGIAFDSIPKRGYCIVKVNENNVAQRLRIQENIQPLQTDEIPLKYSASRWQLHIGGESYFFQEGRGERYEKAKYGGIKTDSKGSLILVGLYDEKFNRIED